MSRLTLAVALVLWKMMAMALRLRNLRKLEAWESHAVRLQVCPNHSTLLIYLDTSKHGSSLSLYGANGLFLAAVAALSILSITSHHESYRSFSTLVLHHSRPAARFVPAPQHHQLSNRNHGTRVVVQDLFGNMPVRVKQRAVRFGETEKVEDQEVESLKKQIVGLLLAWHRPVSVILASGAMKSRKLIIRKATDISIREQRLHGFDESMPLSASIHSSKLNIPFICSLLSKGGYIGPTDRSSWIKAMARTPTITVRGAISSIPAPSKNIQFISLGIRPILSEASGNMLYEEINKAFASSSFGNIEEYSELEEDKRSKDRRFKQSGFTNKQLKGGGKGIDRWPMFYIRIDFLEAKEIERLERENALSNVIKVVKAMVIGFLRDNHFRPRASVRNQCERRPKASGSPRVLEKPDMFSSWSRIKSSRSFTGTAKCSDLVTARRFPNNEQTKPSLPSEAANQPGIHTAEALSASEDGPSAMTTGDEEVIEWTNPVSKLKVLINARTGLLVSKKPIERPNTAPATLQAPSSISASRMTRRLSMPQKTPIPGTWASNFLAKWENPVFAPTEEPIPQANDFESPIVNSRDHHCCDADIQKALINASATFSAKLSKSGLSAARMIAQVDKKFILISIPSPSSQTLVLVDQHAADERIRVEGLIDDLCTAPPLQLPKPLTLHIPLREHALLEKYTAYFARWGITYSTSPSPTSTANSSARPSAINPRLTAQKTATFKILTLPPSIAQKCLLDPPTLLSLLRTTINDMPSNTSSLTTIPPPAILSLLNSRACRSAIMFNDVLTLPEAEVLVRRLAKTRLPFQCAHGRPSMVPVGEVGLGLGGGMIGDGIERGHVLDQGWWRGDGEEGEEFMGRWRGWKGGKGGEEEEDEGDGDGDRGGGHSHG